MSYQGLTIERTVEIYAMSKQDHEYPQPSAESDECGAQEQMTSVPPYC